MARPRLLETADILSRTQAKNLNLLAHSMGTFLTMEAIVQASIAGNYNRTGQLKNIILAAPDIDLDLFRTQMDQLPGSNRNIFILVSEEDAALGFSKRFSGDIERVGSSNADELAGLGVTVLDISDISTSKSESHSKFASSPEIVQLIGKGMESSQLTQQSKSMLVEMMAGIPSIIVVSD